MGTDRKVALVTGGTTGIGLAIANDLVLAGFEVATAGLAAPDHASPISGMERTRYYQCDIADLGQHGALIEAVERDLGAITCLVNNAGVSSMVRGDILDVPVESFDRAIGVNLRGAFFLSQAVARRMVGTPSGFYRSIVFIGSVNAEIVGENRADYCISKSGVAMMSKLFAARLASSGINVFEIRPGIIRTAMTEPSLDRYESLIRDGGVPQGRWGEPSDIARTVSGLASGAIPYATGIHIDVAGGLQLHRV